MIPRRTARLAWSLWALAVVLAGLTAAFYLLGIGAPRTNRDRPPLEFVPVMVLMLLAFSTVGALVASRHPRNPVGWLFCFVGIAAGFGFGGQFYADYALVAEEGTVRGGAAALWLSVWNIAPALTAMTLFALLFPTGRLPSSRWRPVVWLAVAAGAVITASLAFQPGALDAHNYPGVDNPVGIPGTGGVIEVVETIATAGAFAALLAAVASLVVRFRRSAGIERQQLKWIVYSVTVAALAFIAVVPITASPWGDIVFVIAFCALIGVPVSAGIAVLRYRLYDIDVVINRTLVYGALTAMLASTYLGTVLLLQVLLGPLTEESDLAIAGSTLAVAALFRPLRSRIQAAVDRRFYRRKYNAAQTVEAFGARLRDELDLDTLGAELRDVVRETMQPAHVSLWLRGARGGTG